jgi:CheY-like chemotaxis protein
MENAGNIPPLRLLLVEDHEPTMQVITRLLKRAGHQIVGSGSIEEARPAAAREAFDLVISDLGLPDGTGVELMRHLRDTYGLRGIALSGYGTEEDLHRSGEAGFIEHLVKPIDFNDLRRALREFVAMKS